MTINADYIAQHTSSSSSHTMRLVSPTFEPAPNYCIRFWYNTHGVDVQPLKVYAKVTLPLYSFFSLFFVLTLISIFTSKQINISFLLVDRIFKIMIYLHMQINNGLGNPIKLIQPVNSVEWKFGEVEINSEYTAHKFQVSSKYPLISFFQERRTADF